MANGINWGKIYCNSWWGSDSNKDSLPTSEFDQCSVTPVGYTPPTDLTITAVNASQFRLNWINTAFTGSIETIKFYAQKTGNPTPSILSVTFDPIKPTTVDFALSSSGEYTIRGRYSDPINGFSGYSNTYYNIK